MLLMFHTLTDNVINVSYFDGQWFLSFHTLTDNVINFSYVD